MIHALFDGRLRNGLPKRRPTRATVKFGARVKEASTAAGARVRAIPMVIPVLARKGGLGSLVEANIILARRHLLLGHFLKIILSVRIHPSLATVTAPSNKFDVEPRRKCPADQ